jgi:nitrate/nitrite-specific signal transduction histidine kinase
MWSQEGNGLARAIFRISDRLDILFRELDEGVSPATYADTWNECRQELDELRKSVADLNSRVTINPRLSNAFRELIYQTCILQLLTCVDMQIMGCWIAVRADNEYEAEIATSCFALSRQTSAAYANAIRGVTQRKVNANFQMVVHREFVKSFREELLPLHAEGEALVTKMESEGRMPNY